MPGVVVPKRRLASHVRKTEKEDEDDDESESDDSSSSADSRTPSQFSSASKRVRLNDGSASPVTRPVQPTTNGHRVSLAVSKESEEEEDSDEAESGEAESEEEEDDEAHQPGSIVRVKLRNFVTYTNVEFHPGPSLNMVIGPNGTGKSTLVCAICLGLGWPPACLGRAKEIAEFVKHGYDEANIEIELARDPSRQRSNPIIRRRIIREGGKTTWQLNGKNATLKDIQECTRQFSIQIDNLCQFLPQDKVAEFAALTPVELLHSTQRAAAPPEMLEWHDNLKTLGQEQKQALTEQDADKANLLALETRQEQLRGDVQRLQEREAIIARIEMMETATPIVDYLAKKARKEECTEELKKMRADEKELQDLVKPTLATSEAKQKYKQKLEQVVKARLDVLNKQDAEVKEALAKLESNDKEKEGIALSRDSERKNVKDKKQELQTLQRTLTQLENQAKKEPPDFDPAAFNERRRAKEREHLAMKGNLRDLYEERESKRALGQDIKNKNVQAKKDLDVMESQIGKRVAILKKQNENSAAAWDWIQNHRDQFEHHVYGPPIIECSVTDPRYTAQIESLFLKSTLCTFTCQSKADFKKLSAAVYDQLNLPDITISVSTESVEQFKPPMDETEARHLGFIGWAVDYLQGPDPVVAMLCSDIRLHMTGVIDGDISDRQFEQLANSAAVAWVTSKSIYNVARRREYGEHAKSTRVRDVVPPKIWNEQPVDHSEREEIEVQMRSWNLEFEELKKRVREEVEPQIKELETEIIAKDEEIREIEEEKNSIQKMVTAFNGLPTKIETTKTRLTTQQNTIERIRERIAEYVAEIESKSVEKLKASSQYVDAVQVLAIRLEQCYEAEAGLKNAISDIEVLKERNKSTHDALAEFSKRIQQSRKEKDNLNTVARRAAKHVQDALAGRSVEDRAAISTFADTMTPDALDTELESERARLELSHAGNPDALADFNQRATKIQKLTSRIADKATHLEGLGAAISEIREKWEPALDALIATISAAFSTSFDAIGCAGQVSLHKGSPEDTVPDFSAWAILIQVKFRENEPLVALSAQRQSGGERAVSTIFYLMALQRLTRSPFRVVDEINQGMDRRNERLVHERMVEIACTENRSQYFLITPKLLPSLNYHERMRVLCIASGDYVPMEPGALDFDRCVEVVEGLKIAA